MKSKVYPTQESSLLLVHPIDGKIRPEGSEWEVDGFTCRMLADHALTSNPEEIWKGKAAEKPAAAPPAPPTEKAAK